MREDDLENDYWLIIDSRENNEIFSKCQKWDVDELGPPSEWRLTDIIVENGGFRGVVIQWSMPANKRIATVCLDEEADDQGEYGFGGDWWKG